MVFCGVGQLGYSPELNPDEYLNCDLKARMGVDKPNKKSEMKKRSCKVYAFIAKTASKSGKLF